MEKAKIQNIQQPIFQVCHPKFHVHHPKYQNPPSTARLGASWKKKKEGPSGQKAAWRLTDGFHLQDIENTPPLQNTPRRTQTQEILRKSEAHQMVAQSLGRRRTKPRSLGHKAWVSSPHKAGVGSRTKRVPSGLPHLAGCIVLHPLTRSSLLLYCGYPGVYFWDLWDVGTLRPKDYCAQPGGIVAYPPLALHLPSSTLATKCSPMAPTIK